MAAIDGKMESIDLNWVALILEAKEMGIAKETILNFLKQNGMKGQAAN